MEKKTLSIVDAHKEIIKVIPEYKRVLICDLNLFINKLQQEKRNPKYLTEKHVYVSYLNVLLEHLPNRPLANSDPNWMWDCQEAFSNCYNG
jgi:hypothetical protein